MQEIRWDFSLAEDNAGNNIAAKIAIMAMTTSNSINVKARDDLMEGKTPWTAGGFIKVFKEPGRTMDRQPSRQHGFQIAPSMAGGYVHDLFRRAFGHNPAAAAAAFRAQINQPVRGFDHVQIVLNDH